MTENKNNEDILPIRECGHPLIAELLVQIPKPNGEVDIYCMACIIDLLKKVGLKQCGLFDVKQGPINPETGLHIGAWVYNK